MRRIFAEDPNWSLELVPRLSIRCLETIINTFGETQIFEQLTPKQKDFVQERLSPSLPLHVTADVIPDGVYWKRCCEQRWDVCDVFDYGGSWKRMFFERHLENMIELFIPGVTELKTVLSILPFCKSHVRRLNISQLLLPVKKPPKGKMDKQLESGLDINIEEHEASMDHFDFGPVLDQLINLEDLHLQYRIKQCGLNFEWSMFEITDRDCRSLGMALKFSKTLKRLRLRQSQVEAKKCCLLVRALWDHSSLRELDLAHNVIGDGGATAVSELLTRSKLEKLNLCNNKIGDLGAKAIAQAMSNNCILSSLNLRLNVVTDQGGQDIAKALENNRTLRDLHLGGNKLTWLTAVEFSKVLQKNTTLKSINLTCNKLGEAGGKALAEAMSYNSTLTECDIRQTDVDEQSAASINQAVWANQSAEWDKQAQQGRAGNSIST
ncbi:dynein regulatory complex subunit 5 [Cyprinodon tularosa]|uniref:dynein regulatory complex subunit 5 n=1 Tax=Cyprinodon tularosa TaxID=77115 RepID=UPI0018E1FD88|nr:dynein regulatory complex subunit 5 [Cyprinodon tularosa]